MADREINYIEFPAVDLDKTKAFYGNVLGWTFTDYGPEYSSFEGAGMDGGFTLDTKPISSGGVLVVLYFQQLEELQTRISDYGCEISQPIFRFPGGRRFHFIDPNGNELAVWSE